jgi:hypothetical protein
MLRSGGAVLDSEQTCEHACYRAERTSSRAGLPLLWATAFSRRTSNQKISQESY